MKTVKQWLKERLSKDDYKRAKKYKNKEWSEKAYTFESALATFDWNEDGDYWNIIYLNGGSLQTDPIVEAVCEDLQRRSKLGIKKYGTTLKDAGLSDKELLQHAYEETLDLANYLKTLLSKQNEKN